MFRTKTPKLGMGVVGNECLRRRVLRQRLPVFFVENVFIMTELPNPKSPGKKKILEYIRL